MRVCARPDARAPQIYQLVGPRTTVGGRPTPGDVVSALRSSALRSGPTMSADGGDVREQAVTRPPRVLPRAEPLL